MTHFEGEGVAGDGAFAEPSVLIVGIGEDEAVALGARFGQCAIVVGKRGGTAELAYCLGVPLSDDIVYGTSFDDSLIFIRRANAERIAESGMQRTPRRPGRAAHPFREAYHELLELLPRDGEERDAVPADDAAFEASSIEAVAEGHWPEWPAQEMGFWMPEEIQGEFGDWADTLCNGSLLTFDRDDTEAIVVKLEALGYRCVEDGELVTRACGG